MKRKFLLDYFELKAIYQRKERAETSIISAMFKRYDRIYSTYFNINVNKQLL